MDRDQSAAIFKDVVIHRTRTDVPADVVEAMDVALQVFAREPRMEREKEARLAQLETTGRALLDNAVLSDPEETGRNQYEVDLDVMAEFRAVLDGNATPTDRENPDAGR